MIFTGQQYLQALIKIDEEGIFVHGTNQASIVHVVGSAGDTYRVNKWTNECNCPAGAHNVPCKHVIAAAIAGRLHNKPEIAAKIEVRPS